MCSRPLTCCPQAEFCLKWADSVLKESGSARLLQSATLTSSSWRSFDALSSEASQSGVSPPARLQMHELVDMGRLARASQAEKEAAKRGPKSKSNTLTVQKGKCAYDRCPANVLGYSGPLAARSSFRCNACLGGTGSYYHLPCFFECHSCAGSSNPSPVQAHTPGS